jgi:methionine-rich copper-binding protein CopC
MKTLIYTALLTLASTSAFAHSELTDSMPADNASVATAPKELMVPFSDPGRLTALAVTRAGNDKKELGPLPNERRKDFSVASPGLDKGQYTVSWRALSEDAHVMTGEFRFAVGEEVAAHSAEHAAHAGHGEHADEAHHDKH